jgi:hypothetical protein
MRCLCCSVLLALMVCTYAKALPVVPNKTVSIYATLDKPAMLSFDTTGNLFVGNDENTGIVQIYRVESNGSSAGYWGPGFGDPDAIIYDHGGKISGIPASVLVGGGYGVSPYINGVDPNGDLIHLFESNVQFRNPAYMAFDSTGRLLFLDSTAHAVFQTTGENPTLLFSAPNCESTLAIDANDNIYVPSITGAIRIYAPNGTLLNDSFVTGLVSSGGKIPIAFGRGGVWGDCLYAIAGGNLLRIDSGGNQEPVGTGFDSQYLDMTFYENKLYISDRLQGQILEIAPEPAIEALVDINPDTLNKNSKGRWVTVYITLPSGYDISNIDANTIGITSLTGTACQPDYHQGIDVNFVAQGGDHDEDGIADLAVKFDRQELIANLCLDDVAITVEGSLLTSEKFRGTDHIRVIDRGR